MALFSVTFQEHTPKNDAQWHARMISLDMWQDIVSDCSKRYWMMLIKFNLVQIVLETVFPATNRLISAELCFNLIIITMTYFSFRSLSFVFKEPWNNLIPIDLVVRVFMIFIYRFFDFVSNCSCIPIFKASPKSSPAEPDLYLYLSMRPIFLRSLFVIISSFNRSAAVLQAPWKALL